MLDLASLYGIWAGVPIAWDDHDRLDEKRYGDDIVRCLEVGSHGVYTTGSTGEFYALDFDEFRQMVDVFSAVVRARKARGQVGCTWINTRDTIRRIEYAAQCGIRTVQVALPFWMEQSHREVIQFFKDLYASCPNVGLILYNTRRSKHFLGPEDFLEILDAVPTLTGQKYGGRDIFEFAEFCRKVPQVRHFCGEVQLVPAMLVGGTGTYSSFIYVCPRLLTRMYDLCMEHRWDEAMKLQRRLHEYFDAAVRPLLAKGYIDPQIDKLMGNASGILTGGVATRSPYLTVDPADVEWLRRISAERFPEFLSGDLI